MLVFSVGYDSGGSEYLGCQGNNLHVGGAQLAGHGAEDTGATKFAGVVEQYAGVVVEADVGAVGATAVGYVSA